VRGKFYHPKTVERLASEVLVRYQRLTEKTLTPPISAEAILDTVFPADLDTPYWLPIPEAAGRMILAGLAPSSRKIVLNESRKRLFAETVGLLNDTVAHEIGHWVLHVDHGALATTPMPDMTVQLAFTCPVHCRRHRGV
jgi:hypothetical protein